MGRGRDLRCRPTVLCTAIMAEYTEVVEVMNEVHKEKGGTYDEDTAARIIQLAAEFYQRNKSEIESITKRELKRQIRKVYEP